MLHLLKNAKVLSFLALLVVGTTIGDLHNRALDAGRPFMAEDAVRVALKPFQVAVSKVGGMIETLSKSLRSRASLQRERDRLQAEVKQLSLETMQLREDAVETKRLRAALGFKEQYPEKLLATRIISRDSSEWFITATIDRGRMDGVQPGQAVITHRGLLGQVFESSPTSAEVRGLTDSRLEWGVGVMVQRSRAAAVCRGQGQNLLQVTYLAKDADIKPGDIIITSGQGGVMPKGITVGRVKKVQVESGGFMKSATVRPSVRFETVEEAFVVMRKVE